MRPELPTGTVALMFTDIEGSTRLLRELGATAYADTLAEHRRIVRDACRRAHGVEVDTQGDAFFLAFEGVLPAVAAASEITAALGDGPVRLRIGIHVGTPLVTDEGYVGDDVHLAARVAAAGHGGQVLMTRAAAGMLDDQAVLHPLGWHRLKDVPESVDLLQLGGATFPPLRTLSVSTLPHPATTFVGRARELSEVGALLDGGARLLTLTGPGGTGKTRLAIEAAAASRARYDAGAFWVGLAPLRDPSLVVPTIARAVGAKGSLADHIGERRMLILLDNVEQVVAAAPNLADLVDACPRLTLLATSRERLRVRGEREYRVSGLGSGEAVALFEERSGLASTPDVHALCRRLDDLPLAVELAAARTGVLSPAQILERLPGRLDLLVGGSDADARQATLQATIAWSHDLLGDDERRLFRRLAVFAGGAALDGAEAVAEADLDVLQALVDKSLVRLENERFRMLQTIRDFATGQLAASGEKAAIQTRHAEWYAAFLERADRELEGREQERWLDRLSAEHDDVRAALGWCLEQGSADRALRIAASAATYWWIVGSWSEGRRWLDAALGVPGPSSPALRAAVLEGAAHLAVRQLDLDAARPLALESLRLRRELGDARGVARSLRVAGLIATFEGRQEEFRSLTLESEAYARLAGDGWALSMNLNNLGYMALESGNVEEAVSRFEEALDLASERGDARSRAFILENRALARMAAGALEPARDDFADSLRLAARLGFAEVEATDLLGLAAFAALDGNPRLAARLLGGVERIVEGTGGALDTVEAQVRARVVDQLRREVTAEDLVALSAEGRELPREELRELALRPPDRSG